MLDNINILLYIINNIKIKMSQENIILSGILKEEEKPLKKITFLEQISELLSINHEKDKEIEELRIKLLKLQIEKEKVQNKKYVQKNQEQYNIWYELHEREKFLDENIKKQKETQQEIILNLKAIEKQKERLREKEEEIDKKQESLLKFWNKLNIKEEFLNKNVKEQDEEWEKINNYNQKLKQEKERLIELEKSIKKGQIFKVVKVFLINFIKYVKRKNKW